MIASFFSRPQFRSSRFLRAAFGAVLAFLGTRAAPAASVYTTPYAFGSFAGASGIGSADGTGTAARFHYVAGLAVDATGNLYAADNGNHTIRRITPAGVVTTIAGKAGVPGSADGAGAAARFRYPAGLAVDVTGNLYVSDSSNHTIRKITPAGTVATFAGAAGDPGAADGTGSAARFRLPGDLAIDAAGNLYVCDTGNYTVRKISPAGVVTTLAGVAGVAGNDNDGTSLPATFRAPFGIALDASGTVFLFDRFQAFATSHTTYFVRKITPAGVVSTVNTYLIANFADLRDVANLAVRAIVFDAAGNRLETQGGEIHRVAPGESKTTFVGKPERGFADGPASVATFGNPSHLVFDRSGNLYVTDDANNNIRKVTPAGEVSTVAGLALPATMGSADGTGDAARFDCLAGVAVAASGEVYVADLHNYTIRKITPAGIVTTLAGSPGQSGTADGTGSAARFLSPCGIAVDAANNVYVGEANGAIRKITPAGVVTTLVPWTAGDSSPQGIAVDGTGQVYFADTYRQTINRLSANGSVTIVAGATNFLGHLDGTGGAARFLYPRGLAADAAGNLYVADTSNYVIRKITPAGVVTTIAGSGSYGSDDGTGAAASFNLPGSLTVDAAGHLFVADTWNNVIRWITPAGEVSTVAGLVSAFDDTDGTGSDAHFFNPQGIAVSPTGELYVASSTMIRRGVPAGRPAITTQPQGVTAAAGTSVQFSVTASADPAPSYQWYRDGGLLNGATAATLTLNNVQTASAGSYTVVVANPLGTATSAAAVLTVTSAPVAPSTPGGGGGGAPSTWFLATLLALGLTRGIKGRL